MQEPDEPPATTQTAHWAVAREQLGDDLARWQPPDTETASERRAALC